MKTKVLWLLGAGLMMATVWYLLWPSPPFPPSPPGSVQSAEPADTESFYRRSYYTNLTRPEIMHYYDRNFSAPISFRLDLPREEAFSLIRDQTRSSYLEEIIHPGRESLYINVFVPSKPTEEINIDKVHYLNKVTVRYVPSNPVTRLTVLLLTLVASVFVYRQYVRA